MWNHILHTFLASCTAALANPGFQLAQGVYIDLVAEHPSVVTPTGIDVDAKGQVWVIACHTHFRPKKYQGPTNDEVIILSDPDKNGRAQKRTVFYNKTLATMDLELGNNGWVYLAERDRILRVKDADGDGNGDTEETLVHLETEGAYPHNGMAGLCWMEPTKLVFSLGENHANAWRMRAPDHTDFISGTGEGGIFFYDLTTKSIKRIARGFWNPFGVCVRDHSEIEFFAVDNDPGESPPCRLLHVVSGGDYGYNLKYGRGATHPFVAWNGELRGTLPMLHPSGEGPCGIQAIGQGLLASTWSDHRLDFYPLAPKGASYTTTRKELVKGENNFRPVGISPFIENNGRQVCYVTDWVNVDYSIHGQGRVWRVTIDPSSADWLDLNESRNRNSANELAAQLRANKLDFRDEETDKWVRHKDPYIAQAAVIGLSGHIEKWKPEDFHNAPPATRCAVILAAKHRAILTNPSRGDILANIWVPLALADPDANVRFEGLRWIAEADLMAFKPAVNRLLKNPQIDQQLFKAAIATSNTLNGQPQQGVRNTELLVSKVLNHDAPASIRAFALRLLPEFPLKSRAGVLDLRWRYPPQINHDTLEDLLNPGQEKLNIEIVRALGNLQSPSSQEALTRIAKDVTYSSNLRAEAIAELSTTASDHISLMLKLSQHSDPNIHEEALRNLRFEPLTPAQKKRAASDPVIQADIRASIVQPETLTSGRPPLTDTDAWLARLDAVSEPVNLTAGERIFFHGKIGTCGRCHQHNGRGVLVGPDLSTVFQRNDRRWLLKSILEPNAMIAPEYIPRQLTLKDGTVVTGFHLRTGGGGTAETLRNSHGQNIRVPRADVIKESNPHLSLMPGGLPLTMTWRELRDLLAFLNHP